MESLKSLYSTWICLLSIDRYRFRKSSIHGMGHALRVAIFATIIGEITQNRRESELASIAAFFHDITRDNDMQCLKHGRNAAENVLPQYYECLDNLGYSKKEINMISQAIVWHCLEDEPPKDEDYWVVLSILKDADALDRERIKGIDNDYFRFEQCYSLLPLVNKFYQEVLLIIIDRYATNADVMGYCREIYHWIDSDMSHSEFVTKTEHYKSSVISLVMDEIENIDINFEAVNNTFKKVVNAF